MRGSQDETKQYTSVCGGGGIVCRSDHHYDRVYLPYSRGREWGICPLWGCADLLGRQHTAGTLCHSGGGHRRGAGRSSHGAGLGFGHGDHQSRHCAALYLQRRQTCQQAQCRRHFCVRHHNDAGILPRGEHYVWKLGGLPHVNLGKPHSSGRQCSHLLGPGGGPG